MISANNHLIENIFSCVYINKYIASMQYAEKFAFEIRATFPAKNHSQSKVDYI